jgi:hypothetical protein
MGCCYLLLLWRIAVYPTDTFEANCLIWTIDSGYGSVYFAKNKRNGKLVAIKKITIKNEATELACRREISFLKFCAHPTIVKFVDALRVENEIWV